MRVRKTLLVLVILPIVWAGFEVSEARNVEHAIRSAPDAAEQVNCKGTRMTNADCDLVAIAKSNTGPITYFLINQDISTLWATLYLLAGLAGVVISYWLLALRGTPARDFDWDRIAFRLLVGAAAGFICYFLVKLPAPWVSGSQGVAKADAPGIENAGPYALYESLEVLPVLAGLFLSTFFEQLQGVLKRLMGKFGNTSGGDK
jgi:hypothetical protein